MRSRGGFRSVPWEHVLPGRQAEPKVGRPRLAPAEAAARAEEVREKIRDLITGRERTFAQLHEVSDAYESEIRDALRALGAVGYRREGVRVPIYSLPAATAAAV